MKTIILRAALTAVAVARTLLITLVVIFAIVALEAILSDLRAFLR